MKNSPSAAALSVVAALALSLSTGPAVSAATELPQVEGKPVVANINGEPLHLEELFGALAMAHESLDQPAAEVSRRSPHDLLERLITIRLIVQEARAIGLDELAAFQSQVDAYRRNALKSLVLGRYAQEVEGPSEAELDERYRKAHRIVEMRTVMIDAEEDAQMLEAAVRSGDDFEAAALSLVEAGRARGGDAGSMPSGRLFPEVDAALSALEIGEVSPVIEIEGGFVVVQLLGIEFPDDPAAREELALEIRTEKEQLALREYVETLIERYAKVDRELADSLDFDSPEPGFESYRDDPRPLAEIEGEDPITVGELTEMVGRKLYHGTERALESKRLEKRKNEVLQEMLSSRVLQKEAHRLEYDRLPVFLSRTARFEDDLLFATFVNKVIDPDVAIEESDLRDYVERHADRYTTPGMARIEGLIFDTRDHAEAALARLGQGADYRWLAANAPGRVDAREGQTTFDGRMVVMSALPEGARKAIAGAGSDDARIWVEGEYAFHVLLVRELIPRQPADLDQVRKDVTNEVVLEKRSLAVEAYATKLREASDVEIYADGDALLEILARERETGLSSN